MFSSIANSLFGSKNANANSENSKDEGKNDSNTEVNGTASIQIDSDINKTSGSMYTDGSINSTSTDINSTSIDKSKMTSKV